jgi:hypothetical protein
VDGLGSLEHQSVGGAVGGVYKLAWVAAEDGYPSHAAVKVAGAKSTVPGAKMIARAPDFSHDLLLLVDEPLPDGYASLLQPAIASGITTPSFADDDIKDASDRRKADLAALPEVWHGLDKVPSPTFPVKRSPNLAALLAQTSARLAASAPKE